MLWSKLKFHVYKLQRGVRAKETSSVLLLGVPKVSRKKEVMCQIKVAPSKNFGHTLQLAIK